MSMPRLGRICGIAASMLAVLAVASRPAVSSDGAVGTTADREQAAGFVRAIVIEPNFRTALGRDYIGIDITVGDIQQSMSLAVAEPGCKGVLLIVNAAVPLHDAARIAQYLRRLKENGVRVSTAIFDSSWSGVVAFAASDILYLWTDWTEPVFAPFGPLSNHDLKPEQIDAWMTQLSRSTALEASFLKRLWFGRAVSERGFEGPIDELTQESMSERLPNVRDFSDWKSMVASVSGECGGVEVVGGGEPQRLLSEARARHAANRMIMERSAEAVWMSGVLDIRVDPFVDSEAILAAVKDSPETARGCFSEEQIAEILSGEEVRWKH